MSSLLCVAQVCPNQNSHLLGSVRTKKTSLSARTQASEGWTYPRGHRGMRRVEGIDLVGGTLLEDGELYWFRLVGRRGLWKDLFWGGNIRSSRIGNSFKRNH